MALNWVMLDAGRSPVPLQNEHTVLAIDSQVEYTLIIPDGAPPTSSPSAGESGGSRKLKEIGELILTNQRLIFIAALPSAKAKQPSFESITVLLERILSTKFEQPFFGANYLAMTIRPSPNGGLTDGTTVEIRFLNQPLFQFVGTLTKTREMVIAMKKQLLDDEENLPEYSSSGPVAGGSGAYEDMPPGYDA
ncbi:hypothetical protein F5I97DRAFT_1935616 [Phlebopus sp. FC_14]|nr:hypothetical protein F5I97DRAFT_1935616 [Phlebopus sp. FC_14]